MSVVKLLVVSLFALVAFACGQPGMYQGGPNPYMPQDNGGGGGEPAAAGAAACDPAQCRNYCYYASCLFEDDLGGNKCLAACSQRCGNGFFDEQDAKVMACVANAGADLNCDGPRTCCEEQITAQVCE